MALATDAVRLLADRPELLAAVAVLARLALAWQRQVSWYEYRTLHGLKRLVFPRLEQLYPGNLFVNAKGGRDDAEFVMTVDRSVRELVRQMQSGNGSLHLLNALKRRPSEFGDPLSRAHVVWTHSDGEQTEAYLFANADGTVDVYAHHETSVTDPLGHLQDEQVDGDPDGVVRRVLE